MQLLLLGCCYDNEGGAEMPRTGYLNQLDVNVGGREREAEWVMKLFNIGFLFRSS